MQFRTLVAWIQRIVTAVAFIFYALGSVALAQSQSIEAQIDFYLTERVKAAGIPGLTVAVVRDGRVIYSRAFGVKELGKDEKLTPEHIFHFASVSKPFVATAIVQLAEEGKLELSDPVVKHLA